MIGNLPAPILTLLVNAPTTVPTAPAGLLTARGETMHTLIAAAKGQGYSTDFIVDALDRRIRRYLETVGHRGEGDRDNTAYRVACWLLKDFGASESVAWSYLSEWNAGNTPPLHERDLRDKLRSAQKTGKRPAGCAHLSRGSAA